MPRTVAIIPARYGSSRLPGKPLLDICGMPMICHVYKRASEIPFLHEVAVATDDLRIAECIREIGGTVFMTDPSHESGTDRIAQAARELVSSSPIPRNASITPIKTDIQLLRRLQ